MLVVCLCADWCDTCREYQRGVFEASRRAFPAHRFVWVDIENDADLVGDLDIENFPTLLVAHHDRVLFFGTVLPHADHLDRLLRTLADSPPLTTSPEADQLLSRLAAANNRD